MFTYFLYNFFLSDLATSASLAFALQVDPLKRRTIGVITKLDKLSKGERKKILKILSNKQYPLKHGHIGVYNVPEVLEPGKSPKSFLEEQKSIFDDPYYE